MAQAEPFAFLPRRPPSTLTQLTADKKFLRATCRNPAENPLELIETDHADSFARVGDFRLARVFLMASRVNVSMEHWCAFNSSAIVLAISRILRSCT